MRVPCAVDVAMIALSAVPGAASGQNAIEDLLRLHHEQRVAHVLGDAGLIAASMAESFVEVGGGRVVAQTPERAQARFAGYFDAVRFLEWEDVRPPRIELSPDGGWGEVIVEKRVRTIPTDTTRSKRADAVLYAWSSRWVRDGSGWRLASLTSTDRPSDEATPASLAERVRAYEILGRAREAVGGEAAVARVAMLRFSARCEGPRGRFDTEVASARDGRVAFVQRLPDGSPFGAGVSLEGTWRLSSGGVTVRDTLGAVLESVIAAHELHLLAIAPEARYASPLARPSERLDGRDVDVVRFTDRLGAPADFLYDAATGRPMGFRLVNHTGRGAREIVTSFGDWRRVDAIELPFGITIRQGDDVYRYRIVETSTGWLTDSAFR